MTAPGEEDGVADEKDGRVVAHHVPISLFWVELDGETTGVASGVGRAAFSADLTTAGVRVKIRVQKQMDVPTFQVMYMIKKRFWYPCT